MSATSWFIAGLLTGAAVILGITAAWRAARDALHGNGKLLLACGLAAVIFAAAATTMSLSAVAHGDAVAAGESPAPAGPAAAQMPQASAMGMPSAAAMAEMLAVGQRMGVKTAEPMDQAAAQLAARLERRGGTASDWNLLAQAYDFLGRPNAARRARAAAAGAKH